MWGMLRDPERYRGEAALLCACRQGVTLYTTWVTGLRRMLSEYVISFAGGDVLRYVSDQGEGSKEPLVVLLRERSLCPGDLLSVCVRLTGLWLLFKRLTVVDLEDSKGLVEGLSSFSMRAPRGSKSRLIL